MKRYCFDTSGFSNPHEAMPEDIPAYRPLWRGMINFIATGAVAATAELYKEMCHITGDFGQCLRNSKDLILLEVDDDNWDALAYLHHYNRMRKVHAAFISEYTQMSARKTISLNDMTGIALARTLAVPLVSGESSARDSPSKKRIPNICTLENVQHFTFNQFLKIEGIA